MLCSSICKDSADEVARVTELVKSKLALFCEVLNKMWSTRKKSSDILEMCLNVNELLTQVTKERTESMKSLSTSVILCQLAASGRYSL